MGTPKFLRYSIRRGLANRTLGTSGGQVYPPVYQYSFDGIDDYVSIPPITLEGDFEISLYAATDSSGNFMTLGKALQGNTWGFYNFNSGNKYIAQFYGSNAVTISISSAIAIKPIGQEVHHLFRRTGILCEYFIDGVLAGQQSVDAGGIEIDLIGRRGIAAYFYWNGNIRDVHFNDLSNPSNSRLYKMNEGPGSLVMIDSLSTNGSTNGTYVNFNDERWERV